MGETKRKAYKISKIDFRGGNELELIEALESFLEEYKEDRERSNGHNIPLEVFSDRTLGVLETAVKYLKENNQLNYSRIAEVLNRDDRTIWVSYNNTRKKCKRRFKTTDMGYIVPVSIFSDRKLGPLEALVVYVRDSLNLSFKEMSIVLKRDYRTVWISYRNGLKKRGRDAT